MKDINPKISARNVRIAYQRAPGAEVTVAIDGLSVDIAPNSFTCIVGPSGCGKSSFLNAIAGLQPFSGELSIDGEQVSGPGRNRGFVFQSAALLPWRTARQNAAFGLQVTPGVSKAEALRRADEALELVGLAHGARRYPHELSGGMQQRVNLARALALDPSLLLLDEPFAALDTFTRAKMQRELLRVWDETRKTAIFVTHDIEEAVLLADRVIVLTSGPGSSIQAEVDIPFGRPRHDRLEREREFMDCADEIRSMIDSSSTDNDNIAV